MSTTKTLTLRNGSIVHFSLSNSQSRVDYLLALVKNTNHNNTTAADLFWQWIKEGLVERRDFRRFMSIYQDSLKNL